MAMEMAQTRFAMRREKIAVEKKPARKWPLPASLEGEAQRRLFETEAFCERAHARW